MERESSEASVMKSIAGGGWWVHEGEALGRQGGIYSASITGMLTLSFDAVTGKKKKKQPLGSQIKHFSKNWVILLQDWIQ